MSENSPIPLAGQPAPEPGSPVGEPTRARIGGESESELLARLRRRLAQARGDTGPRRSYTAEEAEALEAEVLLLREENARMKIARHQPPSLGTVIEELRALAASQDVDDLGDDVWSAIAELLMIREALEQALTEMELAIDALHGRLRRLLNGVETLVPEARAAADPGAVLPGEKRGA